MSKNSTEIRDVVAGGDIAGRDIVHNNLPHPRQLDFLTESYKSEVKRKETTSKVISELTHYRSTKSEVRDLSEKLTEAGFNYYLEEAEELKELVAKLIIKNQHYRSAQKIITYLLAEVESIFNSEIKPKLNSSVSETDLKVILRTHLEQEILDKLGENVLEIYHRQVNGMVFFLTGNCHLEWK